LNLRNTLLAHSDRKLLLLNYLLPVEYDLAMFTISCVTTFEFIMKVCSTGIVWMGMPGRNVSATVKTPSLGSSPNGE
jgi:hypothetical protein